MKRLELSIAAGWLVLFTPLPAYACTCQIILTLGQQSPVRTIAERGAVFVGTALWVDRRAEGASPEEPRQRVTFIVEASWRGEARDTITLSVYEEAACADYVAGTRYLVIADVAGQGLRTGPCDESWMIAHPAARRMTVDLGPPIWTAPRVGERHLDLDLVPVGSSAAGEDEVRIGFGFRREEDRVRTLEVADQVWRPDERGPGVALPPGIYPFRLTWQDGTTTESYLGVRCETPLNASTCSAYRFLAGIEMVLPDAG